MKEKEEEEEKGRKEEVEAGKAQLALHRHCQHRLHMLPRSSQGLVHPCYPCPSRCPPTCQSSWAPIACATHRQVAGPGNRNSSSGITIMATIATVTQETISTSISSSCSTSLGAIAATLWTAQSPRATTGTMATTATTVVTSRALGEVVEERGTDGRLLVPGSETGAAVEEMVTMVTSVGHRAVSPFSSTLLRPHSTRGEEAAQVTWGPRHRATAHRPE